MQTDRSIAEPRFGWSHQLCCCLQPDESWTELPVVNPPLSNLMQCVCYVFAAYVILVLEAVCWYSIFEHLMKNVWFISSTCYSWSVKVTLSLVCLLICGLLEYWQYIFQGWKLHLLTTLIFKWITWKHLYDLEWTQPQNVQHTAFSLPLYHTLSEFMFLLSNLIQWQCN